MKFIFGCSSSFVLVHFKWTFYCRVRSVEFRSIIGNSIRNKSRLDSNPCWNVELDFFCKVHLEECANSAKKLARNEFEVWRPGRWSARNVPLPRTGRIKAQRRWTAILKRSARQFQQSSNFTFKFYCVNKRNDAVICAAGFFRDSRAAVFTCCAPAQWPFRFNSVSLTIDFSFNCSIYSVLVKSNLTKKQNKTKWFRDGQSSVLSFFFFFKIYFVSISIFWDFASNTSIILGRLNVAVYHYVSLNVKIFDETHLSGSIRSTLYIAILVGE